MTRHICLGYTVTSIVQEFENFNISFVPFWFLNLYFLNYHRISYRLYWFFSIVLILLCVHFWSGKKWMLDMILFSQLHSIIIIWNTCNGYTQILKPNWSSFLCESSQLFYCVPQTKTQYLKCYYQHVLKTTFAFISSPPFCLQKKAKPQNRKFFCDTVCSNSPFHYRMELNLLRKRTYLVTSFLPSTFETTKASRCTLRVTVYWQASI